MARLTTSTHGLTVAVGYIQYRHQQPTRHSLHSLLQTSVVIHHPPTHSEFYLMICLATKSMTTILPSPLQTVRSWLQDSHHSPLQEHWVRPTLYKFKIMEV